MAGFWSKDEILAEANALYPNVYWLLSIAAFFTAFYMGRQIVMVFFGEPRAEPTAHAQENPPLITVPLIILAGLSIFGGALNLPGLHTFSTWLGNTIHFESAASEIHAGSHVASAFNPLVATVSTLLALLAFFIAGWLYLRRYQEMQKLPAAQRVDDPLRAILGPIFTAMHNKWWVDEFYGAIILRPYVAISRFLSEKVDWQFWHDWFHDVILVGGFNLVTRLLAIRIDLGIIDAIANGVGEATKYLSAQMRRIQTGYIRNYALWVFIGVVSILAYLIVR